ncbi:MAG TPA: hypothetical protein VK171_10055 [Fimbriimonas sp.]|nr:hypothetical protein [Fimbriimonas sp.]
MNLKLAGQFLIAMAITSLTVWLVSVRLHDRHLMTSLQGSWLSKGSSLSDEPLILMDSGRFEDGSESGTWSVSFGTVLLEGDGWNRDVNLWPVNNETELHGDVWRLVREVKLPSKNAANR